MKARHIVCAAICTLLCSCNLISSIVHDDQVVAKVGGERLYRSELASYIPKGASPE